jgi:hypothetical protein
MMYYGGQRREEVHSAPIFPEEGHNVKTCILILYFTILAVCGASTTALGGTYKIIRGEDFPVCQDFLANLKALGGPALVCDRKFDPRFKQFSWPKWQTLDPVQHKQLILQIWQKQFQDVLYEGQSVFEKRKKDIDDILRSRAIDLAITRLTINDKPTTVLRFIDKSHEHLNCDWIQSIGREYYALSEDNSQIDFETTDHSLLSGLGGLGNNHRADLFLYNGEPYTAFFSGDVPRGEKGALFLKGDLDFCEFKFNANKKEKAK